VLSFAVVNSVEVTAVVLGVSTLFAEVEYCCSVVELCVVAVVVVVVVVEDVFGTFIEGGNVGLTDIGSSVGKIISGL